MATSSSLLSRTQIKGLPPLISRQGNFSIPDNFKCPTKRKPSRGLSAVGCGTYCSLGVTIAPSIELSPSYATILHHPFDASGVARSLSIDIPEASHAASGYMQKLVLADLDPATAKLAIGFLGPFLSAFGFLFIIRIVMSWYPKLPVGKFPYVLAYAPTEPLLIPTRKLIPPLGGVDVTPVVWFGLISFMNEILVGPQGLLVLLSQQV
ncbi:hypothetical protein HHK36_014603 [Tetracentron sinense]|uniref:Protein COFACTOR ASSEMBLY OF COMPLEX C SUBUNIT B CCB3, chloroplastic n=1 Tax=Tetracentron sinense TaxID=13715 RepID=A0A834Z3P6_TETSI|nr:hypothetical protein HHK36_014603 [Tetracentron sinense]